MGCKNNPDLKKEKDGITYFVREKIKISPECEFDRIAIQTHFINQSESYLENIKKYITPFYEQGDILSISEKVISMCQNNTVDKKDIKLGFWAKFLSKFASSNNHGIAMDEPYKLQLAINLAGLPRILFASFCSVFTKIFGIKGVFYKIAGHGINGIDGFYMNSSFDLYDILFKKGVSYEQITYKDFFAATNAVRYLGHSFNIELNRVTFLPPKFSIAVLREEKSNDQSN